MVTIQTTNMIMLHYIHCFTSFAYTTANYRLIYVVGDDIRTPDVTTVFNIHVYCVKAPYLDHLYGTGQM